MPPGADIARNLSDVRRRITAAAHAASRNPSEITLVAVSKTVSADLVREAFVAGQRVFGENRVQEAIDKQSALAGLDLEWHLIGHLQSNKAKKAAASFDWIESVDSRELLDKVASAAASSGRRPQILIQVDLAQEATKYGAGLSELRSLVDAALASSAVVLRGFMLVPPNPEHAEDSRPWFRQLREIRDRFVDDGVPAQHLSTLSMGMSHDLDVAIHEGATMVRVGTAIFGARASTATP